MPHPCQVPLQHLRMQQTESLPSLQREAEKPFILFLLPESRTLLLAVKSWPKSWPKHRERACPHAPSQLLTAAPEPCGESNEARAETIKTVFFSKSRLSFRDGSEEKITQQLPTCLLTEYHADIIVTCQFFDSSWSSLDKKGPQRSIQRTYALVIYSVLFPQLPSLCNQTVGHYKGSKLPRLNTILLVRNQHLIKA